MSRELNYHEAFEELEKLVAELENGNIQLDQLSIKVKQAQGLIAICETKLRSIEGEVHDSLSDER